MTLSKADIFPPGTVTMATPRGVSSLRRLAAAVRSSGMCSKTSEQTTNSQFPQAIGVVAIEIGVGQVELEQVVSGVSLAAVDDRLL